MSKAVVSAALVALQFGTVVAHDSEKLNLTVLDEDRTLQDDELVCQPLNKNRKVWIDAHWTAVDLDVKKKFRMACMEKAKDLGQNWIYVPETKVCYLGATKPHLIPERDDHKISNIGKYHVDHETGTDAAYGCFNENSKQVPPFECMASHGKYQLDKSWKWKWIYSTNFETRKAECSKAAEEAGLNWMLSLKIQGVFSGNEYYWSCHIGKGHPTIDETNGREAYIGCFKKSPKKQICSDAHMRYCDAQITEMSNSNFDQLTQDMRDCQYGKNCIKQGCYKYFSEGCNKSQREEIEKRQNR